MSSRTRRPRTQRSLDVRFVHQLSEATAVGSTFAVPAAVDPDSRRNGVARYELRPSDGAFRLSVRQNSAAADSDLRVVLVDKLDRETNDRYQVNVDSLRTGVTGVLGARGRSNYKPSRDGRRYVARDLEL